MIKIGITGGIGSGKTLVSKVFSSMQIPVYDADSRAKLLMINDLELIKKIKMLFGEEAYFENGDLNRKYISQVAFNQKGTLEKLNQMVHPAVYQDFERWADIQNAPYVVKEAALMLESDSYKQCDAVILVTADEQIRISRVMQRDGLEEEQIRQRMRRQMPESEKRKKVQFVIENNGDQAILVQIYKLHLQFLQFSKPKP